MWAPRNAAATLTDRDESLIEAAASANVSERQDLKRSERRRRFYLLKKVTWSLKAGYEYQGGLFVARFSRFWWPPRRLAVFLEGQLAASPPAEPPSLSGSISVRPSVSQSVCLQ